MAVPVQLRLRLRGLALCPLLAKQRPTPALSYENFVSSTDSSDFHPAELYTAAAESFHVAKLLGLRAYLCMCLCVSFVVGELIGSRSCQLFLLPFLPCVLRSVSLLQPCPCHS